LGGEKIMKLIVGKSGEGKTQRVIELATELSASMTPAIFTFEDSINSLLIRIHKYAEKRGLVEHEDRIKIFNVSDYPLEEVLEVVETTDADIIFMDGVKPNRNSTMKQNIIDLYKNINSCEEKIKKGIMVTSQRNQRSPMKGVNVIEFLAE
jgi:predicted ATP-dependent serine protease